MAEDWNSIDESGSQGKKPKKVPQYKKNKFDLNRKRKYKQAYNAKFRTGSKLKVQYKPLPSQKLFSDLISGGKKIVLYLGGRQGGKTYAGAFEAIKQIYKYCRRPQLGWIISPTYQMSLVTQMAFERAAGFAEEGGLITHKYKGERAYLLYPPKGSSEPYRVEIKTAENPDRLRGAAVGWIWLDEAAMMSEDVFDITQACLLATNGVTFLTTTPRGRNWIYNKIWLKSETGCQSDDVPDPDIGAVRSITDENSYLSEAVLKRLKRSFSRDFGKQELEAEFVSFEGLVYPAFNFHKHVITPPNYTIPEGAEVVSGMDFGHGDPFCHLWIVRHGGGFHVTDEFYEEGRNLSDIATIIKSNKIDRHVRRRWADPRGATERQELDRFGVGSWHARNDLEAGINEVARIIEQGRLTVNSSCVNLLDEIGQYHYKDRNGRNRGEDPVDYKNHAMDALRYALFSESQYMQHNAFIEQNEFGDQEIKGDPSNYMSNKLEDWIAMGAYIQDEDGPL